MTRYLKFIENFSISLRKRELMSRVIKVGIVFVFCFGVCFYFKEYLLSWLEDPLPAKYRGNLVFIEPMGPIFAHMKISFMGALFIAMPYILYQAWFFISPYLRVNGKKNHRAFVVLGTLFFIAGGAYCYFLALPTSLEYLLRPQAWTSIGNCCNQLNI